MCKKKLLVALLLSSIFIADTVTVKTVNASVRAGASNISTYATTYQNITQYIFENYKEDTEENKENKENKTENISEDNIDTDVWNFSDSEILYLKKTVLAECGYNQPDEGVRMVTDVILNRIKRGWGNDIYSIVSEPYQFSTYWNGAIASVSEISEQVDRIVDEELQNGQSYPSLMYFSAGGYNQYCTPWKKIGDHYFGL